MIFLLEVILLIKSKDEYKKYIKYEKERYYKSYADITFEHKNWLSF